MRENGFTLIEILAVIIVLAILIVITVPNVMKTIMGQEEKLTSQTIKNLGDAALSYAEENIFLSKCESTFEPTDIDSKSKKDCTIKISVATIIESGYFDDPKNNCKRDKSVLVYRYINNEDGNEIDEYRYFIEPDTCYVK